MTPHPRCGIGTSRPHGPHRFRRFLWGMGGTYLAACPGYDPEHDHKVRVGALGLTRVPGCPACAALDAPVPALAVTGPGCGHAECDGRADCRRPS